MRDPLDPFSKAMNDQNRWDPEWYSWLQELAKSVTRLETAVPPTTDLTPITDQIVILQAQVATLQVTSPPGLVFLQSQLVTSPVAAIVFTGLNNTYDAYQFHITALRPSVGPIALWMQMSVTNGATWLSTSNVWTWLYSYMGATTANGHNSSIESNAYYRISGATNGTWGNASEVMVYPNSGQNLNMVTWRSIDWYAELNGTYQVVGSGHEASDSTPLNAVRFFYSGANIISGRINMYGLRRS